MPYGINGSGFALQPTSGHWVQRDEVGRDGGGHVIYGAVRSFEMQWSLISQSELKELVDFFNQVSNTGSVVVALPRYDNASYVFYNYSGCTLAEPDIGNYFEEYNSDVRLLVLNVRT